MPDGLLAPMQTLAIPDSYSEGRIIHLAGGDEDEGEN